MDTRKEKRTYGSASKYKNEKKKTHGTIPDVPECVHGCLGVPQLNVLRLMKHQQGLKRHNAQIVCSLWTLLHHTGPFSIEATETFVLPSLLSNSLHRDFTTLQSVIWRLDYYITWEPSWHPACCLIPQTDVIFHTIFPGQHFSAVGRFIIATISTLSTMGPENTQHLHCSLQSLPDQKLKFWLL